VVQSVELLLDADLDAAVRAQWQRLADAGLPSRARHTGASNRPHVTIAVATAMPPELDPALAEAGAAVLPLPVRLGGMVCFGVPGRRRVLARLVVPDAGLLAVHQAVAAVLEACPGRPDTTLPGRWTPHVTLARGLDDAQLGAAVALVGDTADSADTSDSAGAAVGLRRWDGELRADRLVTGTWP
jgi:2'-5' RNA ligase